MSRDEPGRSDAAPTAIVLAAGAGSRFSDVGHKLTASLPATADRPAESVACRSIAAALESGLRRVVVVTGRLSATDLGLGETAVTTVHNPDWEAGQMTSVRAGLAVADRHGSNVAVIGLADQPGVDPSAWRAVAQVADESSPIAVATYDGRRANPVALHRSIWHLLPAGGDEGARSLMQLRPQLVREVPCTGSPTDIDTAEDLRRWQNS